MNIFGGRPGIAAGVLAVTAILAAAFLTLPINIILIAASVTAVAVSGVLLAFGIVKPYRFFSIAVVFVVVLSAWVGGVKFFYADAPEAEALCAKDAYVHATVAERYISGDYFTQYLIRLKSVNGVPYDGNAVLNCEYNSDLQTGCDFVLRSAVVEYVLYFAEDEALSFAANNVLLRITSLGDADCHILSEGNYTFYDRFDSLNSYLCAKLKNIVGGDAGRLAAAMLLGDRDSLTSEMYRDFRRAGISHYLAVSGLHVSIITGLVSFLLVNLRIKRGLRNTLLVLFAFGYLLILGFPVSAVRSVTMLTIVFLAYSMGDNSDTLNSLGIAAALILIISPFAVFDISFILSFSATLGIAAFLPTFTSIPRKLAKAKEREKVEEEKKPARFRKVILAILTAIMTTLCAVSATLYISAVAFGETSAYAVITNLILAPVGAPMLAASLLCLVFGKIPYLGGALVTAVKFCSGFILDVAASFSDIRDASVSLVSRGAMTVVVIFTVIFVVALIIRIKRKELLLIIPAAYPLILTIIAVASIIALPKTAQLTCISTGRNESIFLQVKEENAIIDNSDGSYSRLRSIAEVAKKNGATEFETVMLTHYHLRHVSALSRFTAEERVRTVLLPYPTTEDEAWIMVQIADVLGKAGCAVRVIEPEGDFKIVEGITLTYPRITRIERSALPVTYLSFTDGEKRLTYLSASSWEDGLYFERKLVGLASESDAVIIGTHGPVNKEVFDIPLKGAECAYVLGVDIAMIVHPDSSVPSERTRVNSAIVKFSFDAEE